MLGTIAWQSQTVVLSRGGLCTSQSLTVHWDTKRPSQATLFRLRRKRSLKCMSALSGTVRAAWRGSVPGKLP